MNNKRLTFVIVTYRVIAKIEDLPHFPGVLWSGFFRNLLRPNFNDFINNNGELELDKFGFTSIPGDIGISEYNIGDNVEVYIQFYSEFNAEIEKSLFSTNKFVNSHFGNNHTLKITAIKDRITGEQWHSSNTAYNLENIIQKEMIHLKGIEELTLQFYTPLKLKNSDELKRNLNIYNKWLDHTTITKANFKNNSILVLKKIFGAELFTTNISVDIQGAIWSENPYGNIKGRSKNSLNGLLFSLIIRGELTDTELSRIVLGQYTGKGRRKTHGSGFYIIKELVDKRFLPKIIRLNSALKRSLYLDKMQHSILEMVSQSSGEEIQAIEDLKRAPITWLKEIAENILSEGFEYSEYKKCSIPKKNGKRRKLALPSILDKMVHKCFQDVISDCVDSKTFPLLYNSSYGFRRGRSYRDAVLKAHNLLKFNYKYGIKIDIEDFFPNINTDQLTFLIESIFPFDPIITELKKIFMGWKKNNIKGLPQGSPLSPVLSNIYLTQFDSLYNNENDEIMFRFADDILILYNIVDSKDKMFTLVNDRLNMLGLPINKNKIDYIERGKEFKYLGHNIDGVNPPIKKKDLHELDWQPVLLRRFIKGSPLFITTYTQNIKSDNNGIELLTQGLKQKLKWNEISRIIVIGKPHFNQDFVFNTMYNDIDVVYLSIWGEIKGVNNSTLSFSENFRDFQIAYNANSDFILNYTKELVITKIKNSIFLLKLFDIEPDNINVLISKINLSESIDQIRGYEGSAARIYFNYVRGLVKPFSFDSRSYHPPKDKVNALLSLGYTFLFNRFSSLLRTNNIDPYYGHYHIKHGDHTTLASDLMEPFRFISDYLAISLIRTGKITLDDFKNKQIGNVNSPRLKGAGFRKYLYEFEATMDIKWFQTTEPISNNQAIIEIIKLYKSAVRLSTNFRALSL